MGWQRAYPNLGRQRLGEALITGGVDLASQAGRTAACVVEWSAGHAAITHLASGVGDSAIVALCSACDKVGIDVPLGWPTAFAEAVFQHSRQGSWPASYSHAHNLAYRYRRTDLAVWETFMTSPPLSVASDRIAIPAMRAAALLSRLPERPPLDGSGRVVEVYPAAALRRWGFTWRGYKGPANAETRERLVGSLFGEAGSWLAVRPSHRRLCSSSDDAFDALVAALVARAAAMGLVGAVPEEERSAALREGWIALPEPGSFQRLAGEAL